jgi:hypothetical protein
VGDYDLPEIEGDPSLYQYDSKDEDKDEPMHNHRKH